MRKFLKLAAFVGLALLVASPALALDFKFGAEYRVRFYTGVGVGFNADLGASNPRGAQIRIRPRFDVSDDNGNMTATLRLEIGDVEWGNGGGAHGVTNGPSVSGASGARVGPSTGGSLGNDGVNVETKWAYMDFAMPWGVPLRLRAGLQPWYLSKGILIDDDVAGLRAYGKWNILSYDFGWYRAEGGVPVVANNAASTSRTEDNNNDFYQAKFDAAIHSAFNPSLYFIYGRNASNGNSFPGSGVDPASQYYLGLNAAGKFSFMSYDIDWVMGQADGGVNGLYTDDGVNQRKTSGWMIDAGAHFPIGPVVLHVVGSYATGDKQNSGKGEMMPYIAPSWNGAGGLYELIGSGGVFDAVEYTQDYPGGLWMMGVVLEYRPVKSVWTKLAYGYAGFTQKRGNCAYTAGGTVPTGCFGPSYTGKDYNPATGEGGLAGKSTLGHEISLRADWDLWTNFKVQSEAGWLIPSKGSVAAEYVLQFLYNF